MAKVGLKFFKRNLFACLQEVTSSLRLFKVASSGLQMMKYFSYRHKLQRFETGLKGIVCFKIFRVILNFNFASFKSPGKLWDDLRCKWDDQRVKYYTSEKSYCWRLVIFAKSNLFSWRHLEISSDRLFNKYSFFQVI